MGLSIGPRIGVQGSEQFRAEFKEMATVARQLKAEMDALTSSFKENDSATKKNEQTKAQLTKQIEQQEKVLEKAKQGVELATKATENAAEANTRAKLKLADLKTQYEKASVELVKANARKEVAARRTEVLAQKSEELTGKLVKVKDELGKNSEEYKTLKKSVDETDKELEESIKTLVKASKEQTDAQKKVDALNSSIDHQEAVVDKTAMSMIKANTVLSEYQTKEHEAQKTLNELINALEKVPGKLQSFGEDLQARSEELAEFGESVSKVLAPMTALSAFSVKGALSFQDALAKISTIADTSKVSLDEFGEAIMQMASDTGFATEDIAAATYQALSAAVKTEDALEFVQGAADLARAGFLDMFGSVDVLTTILNAYGKSVSEVSHISDVLVKTQDMGKTTVNQLAQSMGNVIPTAAQYGITMEDLGAAYVVLTRQGINTARSTTYLRSAFTELEKSTSDASKVLYAATKKSFMQLMKEGKSLGEVMQILRNAVGGDEEAFIHLFGSVRTAAGALALANTSAYEYAQILDEVSNSNGQAARNVQKLQTPTLKMKKAWEQLKTSGIELGQQMIDILAPAFAAVMDRVRKGTEWFKGLNKSTKMAIATFVGVAGAIGPVIVVVGKFGVALGKLIQIAAQVVTGMATFGTVLSAVGVVFGVVAAGALAYSVKLNEQQEAALKAREAEWGLTEEMREHIDVSKDLVTQSREIRSNTEEQARSNLAEAQTAQILLGQLRDLYDTNGKVKKGEETHAEFIKGALADALGVEIDYIDKLIAKNGIYSQSIDDVIQKELDKANVAAYTQGYEQQIQAIAELQLARDKAFSDFKTKSEDEKKALDEASKAWDELNAAQARGLQGDELKAYADKYAEAKANLLVAKNAVAETQTSYENLDRAIDDSTETLDFYTKKMMEASGMTEEEVDKAMESSKKSIDNFKDKNKETFDQIVTDNEEAMAEFNKKLEYGFSNANTTASQGAEGVHTAAKIDFTDVGKYYVDGIIKGIDAKIGEAMTMGRKLGLAVKGATEDAGKVSSPSKVMAEIGGYYGQGFINGLASYLSMATDTASQLANAAMPGSLYSNYPLGSASGGSVYNKSISAPIAVNVNVQGNVDNPQELVDQLEQMLVERIINNERAFA